MNFLNRQEAGKRLAKALKPYKGENSVVLALPRGGVVLGAEVAKEFNSPLGLVLVRKIGHPYFSEYAIGAIAEDDKAVYNEQEVRTIDPDWLKNAEAAAKELINQRRELYYGKDIVQPKIFGKTVIIVDDGIATGMTMKAAIQAVQKRKAGKVIVAVPVASMESVGLIKGLADQFIVLDDPSHFLNAVGAHYEEFDQVNDEEVRALLREAQNDVRKTTAQSK